MLEFLKRLFRRRPAGPSTGDESWRTPVAGQRRDEERLRQSEERFRLLVEGVRDYAIVLLDPGGRVVTWNAGAQRIKGYTAEEIIGQHFSRFYPKVAVEQGWPAEELRRAAEEGRFEDEGWRVRQDGSRFWANVVLTALRDEAGSLRGFAKVTRDLTERRQAEENARRLLQEEAARQAAEASAREAQRTQQEEGRRREQLHVTLASIGDAVIVTDSSGVVTFLNPVAAGLTGWEPHQAAGQPLERVFRIVNEHTRQPVANPVNRVLREGVVVGLANHTVLVARDGREVPIDDSGAPIRGEGGALAGVVLVFRDITERRRAEEARFRLAAIVESSEDAIISKTLDGLITDWNQGAQRLYGYTAAETVGQPISLLIPPDQPNELPAILERLRRGERIEHYETVRRRKDGRPVDVSVSISPVKNAAGDLAGAAAIARDITARKRAAEALRESEARKAAVLETALDAIITIDHHGKVLEFNPAAETMFGYRRAEVLGQAMAERIIPPSLRSKHSRGLTRYLATGEGPVLNQRLEMPALRADGTEFLVELAISAIATGGPPIFTAYLRDISERKRRDQCRAARLAISQILAEAASLEEATPRLLQAVCECLEWDVGALWRADRDAKLLRCAEAWHRPTAQVPGFEAITRQRTFPPGVGLPGRVWASGRPAWIPDVVKDTNFPRAPAAALEGLHGAFAFPVVLGQQFLGVIEFFSHQIREPDADVLEMMATIGSQIGQFLERKQAEEALRQSEQRFARFMQQLPGLAWVKDLEGRYVYANDAAIKVFRRPRPELYGKTDEEVFPPETAAQFQENDRQALESGTGVQRVETLEHDDGVVHHSVVSKFPILGPDGKPVLVGGMAIDITDRLRAEEALKEEARRKDEFLAMLAHELRNPLAPIRNALHILEQPGVDGAVAARAREMAERQVRHLARLLDDLLDVSRISRGQIELRKEVVDVAAVLSRTAEAVRPLVEDRRHELTVSLPAGPVHVAADPTRLEQVLTNLLHNACKYTDPGGRLWLTAQREGGEVVVRVRDTGIGIAAAMLPRIFDLFVQAERRLDRSHGGLGIGLTLVKELVELHGGAVEAASAGPGWGSEFTVRLPALSDRGPGERARASGNEAAAEPPRRRVLVVDDNHDAADSLAMLLRLAGQEVRVAYDGPAALAQAEQFGPELVFLDIGMPGMDGYEVARRLREQPGPENMVLVAVTGWGQEADRRRSQEAGFDGHTVKPAEPQTLQQFFAHPKLGRRTN